MLVELCPSPEATINLRVVIEIRALDTNTVQSAHLLRTIRCEDPLALARVRMTGVPAVNTYEFQVQLAQTAVEPEELLARVRERVIDTLSMDDLLLSRGRTRKTMPAAPGLVLPKLF